MDRRQQARTEMQGNLTRAFSIGETRTIDEEKRTVELSFSSEEPYMRWYGNEILSHDKSAVNLKRLKQIGCALYNHNRDYVIGEVKDVRLDDDRKCRAVIRFDEDAESDLIFQKVKSGTLKGVSVGYMVEEWEEVPDGKKSEDGRFKGPCYIAKKWTPFEISIVSVPADSTVGVGRSAEEEMKDARTLDWFARQVQINRNR